MKKYLIPAIALPAFFVAQPAAGKDSWTIGSADEWKAAIESSVGVTIEKGVASPTAKAGSLRTKMKTFKEKRSAMAASALTASEELSNDPSAASWHKRGTKDSAWLQLKRSSGGNGGTNAGKWGGKNETFWSEGSSSRKYPRRSCTGWK